MFIVSTPTTHLLCFMQAERNYENLPLDDSPRIVLDPVYLRLLSLAVFVSTKSAGPGTAAADYGIRIDTDDDTACPGDTEYSNEH